MVRCILLALIAMLPLSGQRTTFQQLVTDGSNASYLVRVTQNIGQPYHMLFAMFKDAPGHTCTTPGLAFQDPILGIESSWTVPLPDSSLLTDITNYRRILSSNTGGPTNRYRMIATAIGSYRNIYAYLDNWDNVNCLANVWYSGGLDTVETQNDLSFHGVVNNLISTQFSISAATTTTILASIPPSRYAIYGLVLYNSTAAQTITLRELRTDASTVNWFSLTTFGGNQSLVLPTANNQYWLTSPGGALQIVTGGVGPLSGFVIFREE